MPSDAAVSVPDPAEFGARPDISARSVLVTIFGDSVVPAGGEVWLGDLIDLVEQFGFSDRLVRTSMFRLGAEGWFEVERVGRRSRYRLTPWAMGEFAAAETRIYGDPAAWDGQWTLVLVDAVAGSAFARGDAAAARAALVERGFAPVAPGVLAAPRAEPEAVAGWLRATGMAGAPPIARASFHDAGALAGAGWPASAFDLDPVAARYRAVITAYGPMADAVGAVGAVGAVDAVGADDAVGASGRAGRRAQRPPAASFRSPALGGLDRGDEAAFALRTMVVHELRRARLADPELPPQTLPAGWPGPAAVAVASAVYHAVAEPAERWLAKVTGLTVDPGVTAYRLAR